jgi:hypothetical protein
MATKRRKPLEPDDIENKDIFYQYHSCLFDDEEFIEEVQQYRTYIRSKYPPSAGFDPDFLREAGSSDDDIQKMFDIARKWKTPFSMLKKYLENNGREGLLLSPTLSGSRTERGLIILEMSPTITRTQFNKMWPAVETWKNALTKKTNSRNRGPDNFRLLYCVHKAVIEYGRNFDKISSDFNYNRLKGYKYTGEEKKKIYTPAEMEQFYNTYSHLLS